MLVDYAIDLCDVVVLFGFTSDEVRLLFWLLGEVCFVMDNLLTGCGLVIVTFDLLGLCYLYSMLLRRLLLGFIAVVGFFVIYCGFIWFWFDGFNCC